MIELEQLLLKVPIAVARILAAESDPLDAVLPHDPAPQGVVEIDHDTLPDPAESAADIAGQVIDDRGIRGLPERISRHVPHLRVIEILIALRPHEPVEIPQIRALPSREFDSQSPVEFLNQGALPVWALRIVDPEIAPVGKRHALHDHLGGKRRLDPLDEAADLPDLLRHSLLPVRRRPAGELVDEVRHDFLEPDHHHDEVRPELVERAALVEDLLGVLVVTPDPYRRPESVEQEAQLQDRLDRLGRVAAEQRDAQGLAVRTGLLHRL